MRISKPSPDSAYRSQCLEDMKDLLRQPTVKEMRPCPNCSIPCKCSKSPTCTCSCSKGCAFTPVQMSSDGERYPIEENIVPLVYEFNCLRVCPPCWSCEGHVDNSGTLKKIPRVWFYSRSLFYPRMISEYLTSLQFRKKIKYPWHIVVTYTPDDSLETTFSIEPRIENIDKASLNDLQQDALTISDNLLQSLQYMAKAYIAQYDKNAQEFKV